MLAGKHYPRSGPKRFLYVIGKWKKMDHLQARSTLSHESNSRSERAWIPPPCRPPKLPRLPKAQRNFGIDLVLEQFGKPWRTIFFCKIQGLIINLQKADSRILLIAACRFFWKKKVISAPEGRRETFFFLNSWKKTAFHFCNIHECNL